MNPDTDAIPDELIDRALDAFERNWSEHDRYLPDFAFRNHLHNSAAAMSELVRADIDRRYAVGLDVTLDRYFDAFPILNQAPEVAAAIAFEDFRARRTRGLEATPDRWQSVPDVQAATWFQLLSRRSSVWSSRRAARQSSEPASGDGASTSAAVPTPPEVGGSFGDFHLIALLGSGAFSQVFLATQTSLASRYVALKIVRQSLREPVHLARLQHTGIVPLYSFHRVDGYSVLCMPYYGSATLADWLSHQDDSSQRDGRSLVDTVEHAQRTLSDRAAGESADDSGKRFENDLSEIHRWNAAASQPLRNLAALDSKQSALWMALRLAAALNHAHQRGVVHGDLKPANVLIRNDGEPALIDFNLSRNIESTNPSAIGGTLPYMAPEQLESMLGRKSLASTASDIYSLGMLLYELAEGSLAFAPPASCADSDIAAALKQRRAPARRMDSPATTHGLRAIILKCLAFQPDDRYENAASLLEDLEREAANQPLRHARESLRRSRLPKLFRRYPRVFSTVPIAFASLLIVALAATFGMSARNTSLDLQAKSALKDFEDYSRAVLTHLVDAPPTEANAAIQAMPDRLQSLFQSPADGVPASPVLARLSSTDRQRARDAVFDHCLVASALAMERSAYLNSESAAAVIGLLQTCEQFPERADESWHLNLLKLKAARELQANEFDTAEPAPDPDEARNHSIEGILEARALLSTGRPHLALEELAAVEHMPQPELLFWLTAGDSEKQLGQHDAAELSYSLAIRAAPDSAVALGVEPHCTLA